MKIFFLGNRYDFVRKNLNKETAYIHFGLLQKIIKYENTYSVRRKPKQISTVLKTLPNYGTKTGKMLLTNNFNIC